MSEGEGEFTIVRIRIERALWRKVKARAALYGTPVERYVAKVLRKEVEDDGGM